MVMVDKTYTAPCLALCALLSVSACHQQMSSGAHACPCTAPEVCSSSGAAGGNSECLLPCQDTLAPDGCPAGQFCSIDEGEGGGTCRPMASRTHDPGSSGRAFVCVEQGDGGLYWTISHREAASPGDQRWRVWKSCVSDPESATQTAKCNPDMEAAPVVKREPCGDEPPAS
jgi:hypothetical protein